MARERRRRFSPRQQSRKLHQAGARPPDRLRNRKALETECFMIPSYIEPVPAASAGCLDATVNPGEARRGLRDEESDRKIEQTIAYMMEHLNQSLPVAKLAAVASMSPSHYTALFKRRTGCAPIDYFIRLRMRHARDLLMSTSLNVKEVAAALGYEDPFYFSRVFKSVNQVAPKDYRMMHKGGNGRGEDSPCNSWFRPFQTGSIFETMKLVNPGATGK